MNAQIKLVEMWKATHMVNYPTIIYRQERLENNLCTRACANGRLIETGYKPLSLKTFKNDAVRLWNNAPVSITKNKSLYSAKNEIKNL